MSQEIAAVGDPEFTTGFRLAGVRRFEEVPEPDREGALDEAVSTVLEDDDVGIVVMHDEDLEHLSRTVRQTVETSVEPVVVTIGSGTGGGGLREQIKRAIGIDLMEGDNE